FPLLLRQFPTSVSLYTLIHHLYQHSFPTRRSSDLSARSSTSTCPRSATPSPPVRPAERSSRRSPSPTSTPRSPVRSETDYVDSTDRKSTRLNSSHVSISYAVFCLKKKKNKKKNHII